MNDFADQVAAQQPALLRTARQLLRNEAWAEDAVSETLVAALEKPSAFSGGAALRTWLVAILKHKVIDQIRHHTRECQVDDEGAAVSDVDPSGAAPRPTLVGKSAIDPHERLSRLQFLTQLDRRLLSLPAQQGRAFVLRNGMEKDTAEICDELGVTANNLYVLLHRANRRLRASFQRSNHGLG
jgi:RNA polymerase sigma-70 factor, ECF subfamily